jgi:Protein of unknown function (DUF3618)
MGARADAMSADAPELLPPSMPESGYDAAGKSPEQIESDIAETRAGLGEILDAIERQLAPRHLLERGIDMVKDTMSGEPGGLGETLRSHPVPLALIGMGVGWLLISSTGGGRLGEVGGALKERASDAAGQMREAMAGWGGGEAESAAHYPTDPAGYAYARQKSGEAMEQARRAAAEAGGRIGETLERGRSAGEAAWRQARGYAGGAGDRFSALLQEHPLAVGALGLLAGAVVALLLPKSAIEERVTGEAGEALRERAADLGREAAERARQVAERTVDAAGEAVKQAVDGGEQAGQSAGAQATSEVSIGTGQPGRI